MQALRHQEAMGSKEQGVVRSIGKAVWGSDAVAEMLSRLDLEFIALNPGASFRALHDSLVNYLGNNKPSILLTLHEEHAVSIAHGYAKVTRRPMAAALHSTVGLLHASMAIFNAWCDRVPVFVLAGTGPLDASRRRPWIDWIHTASDQASLLRAFTKWDDQPGSVEAALEAMVRAEVLARTAPQGPVLVSLDATLQEEELRALPTSFPARPARVTIGEPDQVSIEKAAHRLSDAKHPALIMGRMSPYSEDWNRRIRLAEALQARVLTDLRSAATFPTSHALHVHSAGLLPSKEMLVACVESDVIVSFDHPRHRRTFASCWRCQS